MNALEGKTVLLTGATGFIGSRLAERLERIAGIKLVLLCRSFTPPSVQGIHVKQHLHLLTKQTWTDHGIDNIDIVFHLAAYTPKVPCEANTRGAIYQSNVAGTCSLLESLPNPPETIIFSSTLDLYKHPGDGTALIEESPVDPSTLYGASKLFCESYLRTFAFQNSCRYAILRYGHIYGPGEGAYRKLIPQVIRSLLKGEKPLIYGDGSVQRDLLYVDDAVEATLRAAVAEDTAIDPLNIVNGHSQSVREYVEILMRHTSFSGGAEYLSGKSGGHSLFFSNNGMLEILGHWDFVPIEEGLRREIEYFRRLP